MKEKMKIGILTYIYAINHGSILQAKAVEQIARKLFPNGDVMFINYAPRRGFFKELRNNIYNKRVLSGLRIVWLFLNVIRTKFKFSNKLIVTDNSNTIAEYINAQGFSHILIGSDTVWESRPSKAGYAPPPPNAYFFSKNEIPNSDFISIAASSDRSLHELWSKDSRHKIPIALKTYKKITVRDQFTADMMQDFAKSSKLVSDLDINIVPDPTFFVDHSEYYDLPRRLSMVLKGDYIIIDISNKKISRDVVTVMKMKLPNCKIVAPMTNRFADINLRGRINPWEWISLHANCKFAITNRFHGTVFCIKSQRKLISIDESLEYSQGAMSKKADLMYRSNLERFYIPIEEATSINWASKIDSCLKDTSYENDAREAVQRFRNDWMNEIENIKKSL